MSKPLTVLVAGKTVQVPVAPGVEVRAVTAESLGIQTPRLGIHRWVAVGDGTFKPMVLFQEQWIRIVTLADLLGMEHLAMYRLARAQFVRSDRPTPNCWRVSVESWLEHQERVQADPWFWEKPENKRRYSEAL